MKKKEVRIAKEALHRLIDSITFESLVGMTFEINHKVHPEYVPYAPATMVRTGFTLNLDVDTKEERF